MVFRHVTLDKIVLSTFRRNLLPPSSAFYTKHGEGRFLRNVKSANYTIYVPEHWNHIYCHEKLKSQMHNKIPFIDLLLHLGLQKPDLIIKLSLYMKRIFN